MPEPAWPDYQLHFGLRARITKLKWTLAPLTIYLGLDTKVKGMYHHNYFLRRNFEEYAHKIFKNSIKLDEPYYYVNIQSMHNPGYAPPGKESVFILCPVPDLRYKTNWDDAESIADAIVQDMSERTGFDFVTHTEVCRRNYGHLFRARPGDHFQRV